MKKIIHTVFIERNAAIGIADDPAGIIFHRIGIVVFILVANLYPIQ